jgi:CBS domain containing-hemolysin-like protein
MHVPPVIDVFASLCGLVLSMVFAAGEAAVRGASKARLETMAEEGKKRAATALALKLKEDELRGGVLFMYLVVVAGSSVLFYTDITSLLTQWQDLFGSAPIDMLVRFCLGLALVAAAALVMLVLPVLWARGIGTRYADALVLKVSGLMWFASRVLRIPSVFASWFANAMLSPFQAEARYSDSIVSEEGLLDMLEQGTRTGILDATEQELIESIFEFTDTTAREIMIPRKDVVAIDASMTPEAILERIIEEGYTRMPVYEQSLDHIIGVVYAKDVVSLLQHKNLIILHDIIRPPFMVPETKLISDLLREFQKRKIHLAVVVDEFGGTEGIITMEDILEEIVGDIQDEYDEDRPQVRRVAEGMYDVAGGLNISDFNELTDMTLPESEAYDTVGGFIASLTGKIPAEGDVAMYNTIEIRVLSVDERRVTLARFIQRSSAGTD